MNGRRPKPAGPSRESGRQCTLDFWQFVWAARLEEEHDLLGFLISASTKQ